MAQMLREHWLFGFMLYHYQLFYQNMPNSQALVLFEMYSTCMQIGHKFCLLLACFYFHNSLIIGMMNEKHASWISNKTET